MAEEEPRKPKSPTEEVSDSNTSEEGQVNSRHRTSIEEREYSTIQGLALATQIALSHLRVQANPMVK